MKLRIVCFSLLAFCLAAIPAVAQGTIYDNGPINGTTDAWTINSGFVVSDTFIVRPSDAVAGISFGAWLFPGDTLESVEVSISSSEFGGTVYSDQIVSFTQVGCSGNQFGFNVCNETGDLPTAVNLAAGTYWLNLQNAVVNSGDPIYWDENSGPSSASENSVGTIPSEAFTVMDSGTSVTSTTTGGGSVPEPGSIILFASGFIGIAGILSRRLL
jgi:PEP-CTERM motif